VQVLGHVQEVITMESLLMLIAKEFHMKHAETIELWTKIAQLKLNAVSVLDQVVNQSQIINLSKSQIMAHALDIQK
jgi:hypothetical protein